MKVNSILPRSILSVYVFGRDMATGKETLGKMHLVRFHLLQFVCSYVVLQIDLAGSERVNRSGVTGDAMKEAQSINYSLSALGDVIAARGACCDARTVLGLLIDLMLVQRTSSRTSRTATACSPTCCKTRLVRKRGELRVS